MDVFVARQPILDKNQRLTGYELLFRNGAENAFPRMDGDLASKRVIKDTADLFTIDALVGEQRAWLNLTRQTLVEDTYALLPPNKVVLELLESIEPDAEVLRACDRLKKSGYTLALDDYDGRASLDPLVERADVLKVDVRTTPPPLREEICRRGTRHGVALLAERVETASERDACVAEGFTLFQGYYFSKPIMVSARDVPQSKLSALALVQLAQSPVLRFGDVEDVLRRDVSLSVKLLRFLNSAAFSWKAPITSLRQAIALLGERQLRRWIALVGVTGLGDDRPGELVTLSLVRARLCEQVARTTGIQADGADPFLLGMLSVVDALVGRPLPDLLREIFVSPVMERALLFRENVFGRLLTLVCAWEAADWDTLQTLCASLGIDERAFLTSCADASAWARDAVRSA